MNADVVLAYIALGGLSQLILLRNPSPGRRYGAAIGLIVGGLLCGWFSTYLPYPQRMLSIVFAALPYFGRAIGQASADLINLGRIWWHERKEQHGQPNENEWQDSTNIERGDRDVSSDCEAKDALRTYSNGRIVREYRPADVSQGHEESAEAND